MTSGGFLLFAFGSLLDEVKLTALDSRCESMGLARADGQKLTFTESGVANLKPELETATWGMLWLVPAEAQGELDAWAKGRGLNRGVVSVVSPAGPRVPTTAYFNRGAPDGLPSQDELLVLVTSAVRLRMNRAYQAELAERFGKY